MLNSIPKLKSIDAYQPHSACSGHSCSPLHSPGIAHSYYSLHSCGTDHSIVLIRSRGLLQSLFASRSHATHQSIGRTQHSRETVLTYAQIRSTIIRSIDSYTSIKSNSSLAFYNSISNNKSLDSYASFRFIRSLCLSNSFLGFISVCKCKFVYLLQITLKYQLLSYSADHSSPGRSLAVANQSCFLNSTITY